MKKTFILLYLLGMALATYAQNGSISGTVKDFKTKEVIAGASVLLLNQTGVVLKGSAVSPEGKYTLDEIEPGSYILKASFIGYSDFSTVVTVRKGQQLTVEPDLRETITSLDDITVTSGRKAEKVSEAAANIQLIRPKTVQISKEPTVFGLLKNTNGVDFIETGLGQQQVNARGFASVFTGGMLTLVDYRDVSLPGIGGIFGATATVSPQDIKQVEVIVGPNSALYGSNASQGVVNILTKSPKEYAGQSITIKGGNRDQFGVGFRSSDMLGKRFGYKLSGDYTKGTDFNQRVRINPDPNPTVVPIFTDPDLDVKNSVINGGLYFFPTQNIEVSATSGFSRSNFINQSNIGALQAKNFDFWYYQLRTNINNFLGLGSAFAQVYYVEDNAGDTYNLETVATRVAQGQAKETAIQGAKFVDRSKRLVAEFQQNIQINDKNSLTYGGNYNNTKPNSGGTFLDDAPGKPAIKIDMWGVYAQYENSMVNNLKLTLTGRYDNNSVFGDQFSPKVGLSYKVAKNHNFRAVYNQAFSSPPSQPSYALSFVTTLQTNPPATPFPSIPNNMILHGAYKGFNILDKTKTTVVSTINKLAPTTTKAFEFGYKGLLFNKLYLDLTYFTAEYRNFFSSPIPINNPELILNGPAGPIPTGKGWRDLAFGGTNPASTPITYVEGYSNELVLSYINFGKVNIQGVNAAAQYSITDRLSANLAYSHTHYGNFKEVPATITTTGSTNSPTNVWKGGLSYSDKKGLLLELTGRRIEKYSIFGARVYNRGEVPTFTVFDLKGERPVFKEGKFRTTVGINIKNMFNNKHIELPGSAEIGLLALGYVRFDLDKK